MEAGAEWEVNFRWSFLCLCGSTVHGCLVYDHHDQHDENLSGMEGAVVRTWNVPHKLPRSPGGDNCLGRLWNLDNGISLEEVSHRGWTLIVCDTASLPECRYNVTSQNFHFWQTPFLPAGHIFTTIMDCILPREPGRNKFVFLTLLLLRYFIRGTRK